MTAPKPDTTPTGAPDCSAETRPIPRRSRPARRAYSRHGLVTLKATLRALGPRVIDRRTHMGRALASWRADLVRDLGDDVTTAQAALIDLAVRSKLLLDSIDAWLLTQPSLVNARRRALLPVVRERQALADGLARYMTQLGLERRAKPVADLSTYLAQRMAQTGSEHERRASPSAVADRTSPR